MDVDNSVVIAGSGGIRGLNGNGKINNTSVYCQKKRKKKQKPRQIQVVLVTKGQMDWRLTR